jgi:citrate/tricarballylate utilization protein
MSATDLLKEADRVMTVCNACRYCEGFCAVFPAMELRRTFTDKDLKYLANLCHNCRACYYACQYAPPHEFALNVPRTLAELRLETYKEFSWPTAFKGLFEANGPAVLLTTIVSVLTVLLLTLLFRGSEVFFGFHTGATAFYRVIPYPAIVAPFSLLGLFILVSLWKGVENFRRAMGAPPAEWLDLRANARALWAVLRLRYLDGGSHGCNYPDERFSMIRRYFHHATFYGFVLCLGSTTLAAIYDHFLHLPAPYPFWSWPVVMGTAGGISLVVGTSGLLFLKAKMDRAPAAPRSFGMDVGFTLLLLLTSLTGLLLLLLRATPFMGALLSVHLGLALALFITMPYGKFVHAIYRYTALLQNAVEQSRDERKSEE